ncbi:MAG: cytochrome bd-I oxidase subunit CydX [Pseudomonadota bacterium]
MWYFTWLLGLGFAVAAGIINAMWLEAAYFGKIEDEERNKKIS